MRKILLITAAVAALAMSAEAALSAKYTDWAKGPAQFIMTKDEQAKWKTISNDADAQAFIDLFWARRDPNPATPQNEFREDFDARVKYADEKFTEQRTPGSMTDRGRVLIIMGPPQAVQKTGTQPQRTIQGQHGTAADRENDPGSGSGGGAITPGSGGTGYTPPSPQAGVQDYSPKQLWLYEQTRTQTPLYQPKVEIAFVDQYGNNQWRIERTPNSDYISAFNYVNQKAITQPNLTEAPKPMAAAPAPRPAAAPVAAPAAAPVAQMGTFKTEALHTAADQALAGTGTVAKNIYLSYGEYITPAGEYFIPVQLYVPGKAGLDTAGEYTFFGEVQDASGKPAAIFEEPAKLSASKDDYFFDRTVMLPPGKYKGTFGLAKAGAPISMVTSDMDLTGLTKDAVGVSQLILSNNVYTLASAQRPTDPYAFGGIKVVPKSDMLFHNSDELWYFFEMRNPGVDASTKPGVKTKLTLSGKTLEGKSVTMNAPEQPADVVALNGVPGHFAVASSIPLTNIKPGDYTLKVKVTDTVKNQTYDLAQPFKVVATGK